MCTSFFGCWLLDKVIYLEAVKLAKYIFFSGKKQARKLNISATRQCEYLSLIALACLTCRQRPSEEDASAKVFIGDPA